LQTYSACRNRRPEISLRRPHPFDDPSRQGWVDASASESRHIG
jgi:hypothetical protein